MLSEELAFEACAELANEILKLKNIPDRYTGPGLLENFVGQNFRGMMVSLEKKHNFTLTEEQFDFYVNQELAKVIATLEKKAKPCVGVMPELEKLAASKKYGLAVVSSSAITRVQASIKKVGQDKFFPPNHIFSAATSLPKPTSKPDPAIYIFACKQIGVEPGECVAVEDSVSGATSAVRAGIPTIGYVGSYETAEKQKEMVKVLTDTGAKVIMEHWSEFEGCLAKIEKS